MRNYKFKLFIICLLGISILILLSSCKDPDTKLDSSRILKANAINNVMKNHKSIKETIQYYENLDGKETYETVFYYSTENNGTYILSSHDLDNNKPEMPSTITDESNLSIYVTDDIEYRYFTDSGKMKVFPLTANYMDDILKDSFVIDTINDEDVKSIAYENNEIKITTETEISKFINEETTSKMEELAEKDLSSVRYVYTADKDTLLISSVETFYVTNNDSLLSFSKATIEYNVTDENKPSTKFVDQYLSSVEKRNVIVIEDSNTEKIIRKYSLPASLSPDFRCFETFYDYTIYTDEKCTCKYTSENPDETGKYPDATFYAKKNTDDDTESKHLKS